MKEIPGVPFHGEFSSTDASGLSEPNARFTLYGAGSVSAITLSANDYVHITSVVIVTGATISTQVYDGANNTVDAGEQVVKASTVANAPFYSAGPVQHVCQVGTYPKVKTSGAGQVDVCIRGTIQRIVN